MIKGLSAPVLSTPFHVFRISEDEGEAAGRAPKTQIDHMAVVPHVCVQALRAFSVCVDVYLSLSL